MCHHRLLVRSACAVRFERFEGFEEFERFEGFERSEVKGLRSND